MSTSECGCLLFLWPTMSLLFYNTIMYYVTLQCYKLLLFIASMLSLYMMCGTNFFMDNLPDQRNPLTLLAYRDIKNEEVLIPINIFAPISMITYFFFLILAV